MTDSRLGAALIASGLILGLGALGYLLGESAIRFKEYERTVTVKGLSEREVPADVVIWPIQFTAADNDLTGLYETLETSAEKIRGFLEGNGIAASEISVGAPAITDKSAQQYGGDRGAPFRYTAMQTVTVYSSDIEGAMKAMSRLSDLGRQGIVLSGDLYATQTEYVFTGLNELKPNMVEEATKKAREVAEKFAQDSASALGKIKRASQGQFSIAARDKNNPHIKKVRVVSTVEYYLSD